MTAGSLVQRRLEPEAMDDPSVDPVLHRAALEKLAQFNFLAGSSGAIGRELLRLGGSRTAPLRVLDLATGAGDLPRRLMRRSDHKRLGWSIDGADVSRNAVEHAREGVASLPAAKRPHYFVLDALREPLPRDYDVLTCSLFLHHLSAAQAVSLLSNMRAAAKRAVIVQDLLRSPAALRLAWIATRLCSRNKLILDDGPASVAAAFTLDEARDLAREAGFSATSIVGKWPYRWILSE